MKELLPVMRAAALAADEATAERWLIEGLWTEAAVGLIGGQPKCLKSWLALEMAVSVATATPCLRSYPVHRPGPALVYMAEDALHTVRDRLEALSQTRHVPLARLDVHVITAPVLRLDLDRDQGRLRETARALAPRLLVLDPLVRLHRLDENSSAEVSHFLAYLRALQRELDLAILLVHHTRKSGSPSHAAGQSLRGSGDFHAWADSAIYLRRQREDQIHLTVEHRAAPGPPPVSVRLSPGDRPHLELARPSSKQAGDTLQDRVLAMLRETSPLTRAALRERLAARNESLGAALDGLLEASSIVRWPEGYALPGPRSLVPSTEMRGNGTLGTLPDPGGGSATKHVASPTPPA